VGAALLLPAAQTASAVDASDDRRAIEFARVALAQAPPEAVVVTFEDRDTFALWYDHFALRRRPDLAVVAEPLLVHEWYRRTLRATYPWLAVADSAPSGGSFGLARADGASLTVCRAVLEAPTGLACDG
jgi:hypothetical protein